MSSVVREGSTTSSIGKKKRERFARSRSGIQLPISMHLARFKFRDSGKSTGISQSLDAGDVSETNESFDELRVKRTASAPTRDGSSSPTPPRTFIPSSPVSGTRSSKPSHHHHHHHHHHQQHQANPEQQSGKESEDSKTGPEVPTSSSGSGAGGGGGSASTRAHSSYVCVQLEGECDTNVNPGSNPSGRPNGGAATSSTASSSTTTPGETKLKGIVQPLRTSTGWL